MGERMKRAGQGARGGWTWVRTAVLAGCVLVCAARGARAQAGGAPPPPEKLVQVSVAPVHVTAGGSGRVIVQLALLPGWHVNANPPALEYNIPTKVTLDRNVQTVLSLLNLPSRADLNRLLTKLEVIQGNLTNLSLKVDRLEAARKLAAAPPKKPARKPRARK